MARMTKAAIVAKIEADRNATIAALTEARDTMIAKYETLQASTASAAMLSILGDAINNLHDRIAELEDTRRYVPIVRHDPILDGTLGDPIHY